MGDKNEKTAA
jgi:hypothetical protein